MRAGQQYRTAAIAEFQAIGLAQCRDGRFRIIHAGQLDNHAVFALALYHRLADAKGIDAITHNIYYLVHHIIRQLGVGLIRHSLQHHLCAALQIQA